MHKRKNDELYQLSNLTDTTGLECGVHLKAVHNLSYKIIETNNLFSDSNVMLYTYLSKNFNTINLRCFLVMDSNINDLYGEKIRNYFRHYNIEIKCYSVDSAEEEKSIRYVLEIIKQLDIFNLSRRCEPIIAIGGGITTDIAGLAANLYRRGTPCIKIPTTLMGLIDAGIGVKTGINFNNHKNRIGTYCCPSVVFIDCSFLHTLSERHFINGLAEIVKMSLIKDGKLFDLLEENVDNIIRDKLNGKRDYSKIIRSSIRKMLEELVYNLWEEKLERVVDYGHTFSPKIEMYALPELLHGEAVSVDIAYSVLIAEQRRLISTSDRCRIFNLMNLLGLPLNHSACKSDLMMQALEEAKLHRDGKQRVPLTKGIGGAVFVNDISKKEIDVVLNQMRSILDG